MRVFPTPGGPQKIRLAPRTAGADSRDADRPWQPWNGRPAAHPPTQVTPTRPRPRPEPCVQPSETMARCSRRALSSRLDTASTDGFPSTSTGQSRETSSSRRSAGRVSAYHQQLGVVVQTRHGDAAKLCQDVDMATHERLAHGPGDELHVHRPGPAEHHYKGPNPSFLAVDRSIGEAAEIHLC